MNLCDYCQRAERDCPIWAPSGSVAKCREWQPITRHEYKAVCQHRDRLRKILGDFIVGEVTS